MNRAELRHQLRQRRRALSCQQQQFAAHALVQQFRHWPPFQHSQHIAFYHATDGEINPAPLIQLAHKLGKTCYLPRVLAFPRGQLRFVRIGPQHRLHRHRWGMAEPRYGQTRPAKALDMICLPLVGFDRTGQRLGMGGGFYDRTLAKWRGHGVTTVGLAHACQELTTIPCASWDIPLQTIMTPEQRYQLRSLTGWRNKRTVSRTSRSAMVSAKSKTALAYSAF